MYCPNCGNTSSRNDYCEYCGYSFITEKKKSSFHFPVLPLLLILFLLLFMIILSINYWSLDGASSAAIHKNYSSPDELISDYLYYAKQNKPRYILSLYHKSIIEYYSQTLKNNEDILWAVDSAYRDGVYSSYEFFIIDKRIDWTNHFYQGELEKHNINCTQGKDIRLEFQAPSFNLIFDKYYFELVNENGYWYVISVYK